jgi:hypothetical protein
MEMKSFAKRFCLKWNSRFFSFNHTKDKGLLYRKILLVFILSAVLTIPFASTVIAGYTVTQISTNSSMNYGPQINNNGDVVWYGQVVAQGWDFEIFFYDKSEATTTQLTTDDINEYWPRINDNGQIVWCEDNVNLTLYNTTDKTTTPIPILSSTDPQSLHINDNGDVVWDGYDAGASATAIYLYKAGDATQQIELQGNYNHSPQINNTGRVVWVGSDIDSYAHIFLYDSGMEITTQISSSLAGDYYSNPQINDGGQVVFQGDSNNNFHIFLYDGSITPMTYTGDNYNPQINNNGYIVWAGHTAGTQAPFQIFLYDKKLDSIRQLTNNSNDNRRPQINNNGYVVWGAWDGNDGEIFLYNGATVTQLTDNDYEDSEPQINDNNDVTWQVNDAEKIFLASYEENGVPTPKGGNVSVQPVDPATEETPVTLTFDNVTDVGFSYLTIDNTGPPPPSGFMLGTPPTYYEISSNAYFTGSVEVCINFTEVDFKNKNKLKLYHYENGAWVDCTTSLDVNNKIICGSVTSLSPFALLEEEGDPITNLITLVQGMSIDKGVKKGLVSKLNAALKAINANDTRTACMRLLDFINLVNAQIGKKINMTDANQLIDDATDIRTSLGC